MTGRFKRYIILGVRLNCLTPFYGVDMEKDIYYVQLFDIYGDLLTQNQRDLFYSHYCLDLSFAEIAEETGTTRQSVFDAIKKVKEKLDEYEGALRLKDKFDALSALAETLSEEQRRKIKEITGR